MRDYYEVLGVSTDASEDDVRRSYKTLALRYHPDRHTPDEQAHYSRLFQEVHDAYLVLSDPQERAWYDDHRASLLHGGRGGSGDQDSSAPPPDQMLLNLWPLFDPKCFDHQYDDAPGHFYSVYRDLFDRLWREEQRYGKQQQQQKKTPKRANHHQPPKGVSFGDSNSLYSDVSSFYRYWRQFRSVKRFGWVDQWRREHLSAAPNRQVRRAMERQNEQQRQAARKEHSDLVRRLVEFVHRRDPRVKAERERRLDEEERQQEELRKEQQRKQEIERIAAQMRERQRQQLLEEEDYDDDEDGDGDYYYYDDDDDDGDGDDDDDEGGREGDNYHDEVDELEDIVQKYLAMERERENEKEEEEEEEGRSGTGIGKGEDVKEEDGRGSSSSNVFEFGASDGDEDDDNEDEQQQQQQSSKKKKRQKRDKKRLKRQQRSQGGGEQQHAEQQQQPQHQKEKEENDMAGTYVSGAGSRSRKRKQKQKKKKERSMMDVDHRSDDGVDDDALNADVVDHLNSAADNDSNADAGVSSSDQEPRVPSTTQHALGEDDSDLTSGTEREKEAEEEKDGDEGDLKKSKRRRRRKQQQPGNAPPLKCNVCGETFSSRNKLFQHVNELGHELAEGYSQQQRPAGAGRKGKKKK